MEFAEIWRFAAAFFIVCGLIGVAALVARRYFRSGFAATRQRQARLAVVERLMIDPRHQLLIIRKDNKEHLLVQHPQGITVIEQGSATADVPVISPVKPQMERPTAKPADEKEDEILPATKAPYFSFRSMEDAE